jgi:hypothetical protein
MSEESRPSISPSERASQLNAVYNQALTALDILYDESLKSDGASECFHAVANKISLVAAIWSTARRREQCP